MVMSISGSGGDGSQAAQRRAIAVISEGVRNTALPRGGCLRLNPGSDARALHINLLSDSLQALWICQRSGPRTSLRRTSLLIRRKRRLGKYGRRRSRPAPLAGTCCAAHCTRASIFPCFQPARALRGG